MLAAAQRDDAVGGAAVVQAALGDRLADVTDAHRAMDPRPTTRQARGIHPAFVGIAPNVAGVAAAVLAGFGGEGGGPRVVCGGLHTQAT